MAFIVILIFDLIFKGNVGVVRNRCLPITFATVDGQYDTQGILCYFLVQLSTAPYEGRCTQMHAVLHRSFYRSPKMTKNPTPPTFYYFIVTVKPYNVNL